MAYVLVNGLPRRRAGKESACQCRWSKRRGFSPWVRKIPWRRKCQPAQYSCLGHPMDRGAWWATYNPWDRTESDTAERAHTHVLVNSNLFSRVLARHLWRDAFCYNWCNIDWTAFTPNSYDETLTSKVIICRAHKEVITRSSKGGGPDMIRLTPLWGETPKDALPNSAPCSHNDEVLWGYGKMETTTREASMETTLAFWSQTSSL